jgi:hypothetical protein
MRLPASKQQVFLLANSEVRAQAHLLVIAVVSFAMLVLAPLTVAAQDVTRGVDPSPIVPQQTQTQYVPITPKQRLIWFTRSTVGMESLLLAGPWSAGWGTATDRPHEYNTSWEGFGQRYGIRLTGVSTGNAMEAGLGALWGEDPRYFRTQGEPFKKRVVNVIDLTFRAYRDDGERHFAYARLAGNVGNNFLSNTWRVPSESDWQSASIRVLEGIGGKAVGNAAYEFFPTVVKWLRGKH